MSLKWVRVVKDTPPKLERAVRHSPNQLLPLKLLALYHLQAAFSVLLATQRIMQPFCTTNAGAFWQVSSVEDKTLQLLQQVSQGKVCFC